MRITYEAMTPEFSEWVKQQEARQKGNSELEQLKYRLTDDELTQVLQYSRLLVKARTN